MSSLKKELYETVRRSSLKVSVLADRIGIGPSYLYKATTPESGINFPLEWLVPLMDETGDFRVLFHLNRLCGFAEYKIPIKGMKKGLLSVAELQKLFGELLIELNHFYDNLNDTERSYIDVQPIINSLENTIKALAAQKHNIERFANRQMDLFEEGGLE